MSSIRAKQVLNRSAARSNTKAAAEHLQKEFAMRDKYIEQATVIIEETAAAAAEELQKMGFIVSALSLVAKATFNLAASKTSEDYFSQF